MAGTASSSPYIKDEPKVSAFSPRPTNGAQPTSTMSQQHFSQFGQHGGGIDPNDLAMGVNGDAYSGQGGGYPSQASNSNGGFSKGISSFDDDELLDGLGGMDDGQFSHSNGPNGPDFGMDFNFTGGTYPGHNGSGALSVDPNHISGYSHTPEGDPIQSPFVHNFNHAQFRHMQPHNNISVSLQSPGPYTGSPMLGADGQMGDTSTFSKQRPRLSGVVHGRRSSNNKSPLTPRTPGISTLNIGSAEHTNFPAQPIRTSQARHGKTLSGQWDQTPNSLASYPGSDFGSPIQGVHNPPISGMLKSGTSMPAKLGNGPSGSSPALQSQEMKRRRRRESHNLVERRRRDNINERIQELSSLVPHHRLEDEKVRKALQNNSPLSPTLAGLSAPPNGISPPGPGLARRGTAGNITTGIPIDDKDKGPNKGDILNGAVSWTKDLMWMLHVKLQQQEELANMISELGGVFPFEPTESERRMHTELGDAMSKNSDIDFSYSRHAGSGLRVPKHTDIKGDVISGLPQGRFENSVSPDNHSTGDAGQAGIGGSGQYWSGHNSGGSGAGSITFKEEDEYGMDLTQ